MYIATGTVVVLATAGFLWSCWNVSNKQEEENQTLRRVNHYLYQALRGDDQAISLMRDELTPKQLAPHEDHINGQMAIIADTRSKQEAAAQEILKTHQDIFDEKDTEKKLIGGVKAMTDWNSTKQRNDHERVVSTRFVEDHQVAVHDLTEHLNAGAQQLYRHYLSQASSDEIAFLKLKTLIKDSHKYYFLSDLTWPEDWETLVAYHIENPSLDDFGLLNKWESEPLPGVVPAIGQLRLDALRAISESDHLRAKRVLAIYNSRFVREELEESLRVQLAQIVFSYNSTRKTQHIN